MVVDDSYITSPSISLEVDEENGFSSQNGTIKGSSRDEIYTLYKEKQSTVKSSSKLNGFNAASLLIGDGYPLLKLNGTVRDAELLKSFPPSGYTRKKTMYLCLLE